MIFSTCKLTLSESEYPVLKQSLTCPRRLVKAKAIHHRKLTNTYPTTLKNNKHKPYIIYIYIQTSYLSSFHLTSSSTAAKSHQFQSRRYQLCILTISQAQIFLQDLKKMVGFSKVRNFYWRKAGCFPSPFFSGGYDC